MYLSELQPITTRLYTLIMGLEDRQTNWVDNRAQDVGPNSEARRSLMRVDDAETGFHILASMIADFHLRHKNLSNCTSMDDKSHDTPR